MQTVVQFESLRLRAVLAPLVLVLTCLSAMAENDVKVREALALTESGQHQQAFDLLAPLETQRAGDTDFDLVFGIAANQSGNYTRAIFALERVLMISPGNQRARLELGRALYSVGENTAARQVFEQAKLGGVPSAAAKTIDELLQTIDRLEVDANSSTRAYIEIGAGQDTNINGAPSKNLFGLSAVESSFGLLNLGVSGRKAIDPRWSAIGSASLSVRSNGPEAVAYDTSEINLSGGAAYRLERNEYALALSAGNATIASQTARTTYGLTGEWTYRINAFQQFNSYLQVTELAYPQKFRNVIRYVAGASYGHQFRTGTSLYGGGFVGEENPESSGADFLGQKFYGVRLGGQQPLNASLAAFANLSIEDRTYNAADPFFLNTRHDLEFDLTLGANWVPAKLWRVTPQWTYTRINSNIPVADSERQVFSVIGRREY